MGFPILAPMNEMIEAVKKHALANYDKGGWDVVYECWTDGEIAERLRSENCKTPAHAIACFNVLAVIWAERQADAEQYRNGF